MVKPLLIAPAPQPGHRPPSEPDAPNLPSLWQAAARMHDLVVARIASPDKLSHSQRMPYNERRGLLAWIEPIEEIVRLALIAGAITFLLMTVKGRKLLRDTPKMAIPKHASIKQREERIVMPHPGWHTIARRPPASPAPAARQDDEPMSLDPRTWTCPFRVFRWRLPEDTPDDPRTPMPGAFRMLLESIRDRHLPPPARPRPAVRPHEAPAPRHPGNPSAVKLARRLEAIGRVIANPDRHILRVARYLARVPHGILDPDFDLAAGRHHWQQGREAYTFCVRLLCSAIRALNLCQADPEPG